eukprot:m.291696 g.291696  ORF g.291696 m.291696 type:complete len:402 (-) comp19984_c0_seq1:293-1498(-)
MVPTRALTHFTICILLYATSFLCIVAYKESAVCDDSSGGCRAHDKSGLSKADDISQVPERRNNLILRHKQVILQHAGSPVAQGVGLYSNQVRTELLKLYFVILYNTGYPMTSPWSKGIKQPKSPTAGIDKKYLTLFAKQYRESVFFAHVFPSHSSVDEDDLDEPPVPMSSECTTARASYETAALLNTIVRKHHMTRTVEVGFACGISAASIATAHHTLATQPAKHDRKMGKTGRHYAIDPAAGDATHELQRTAYKGAGQRLIRTLGLEEYFHLLPVPSHQGLSTLLSDHGAASFQMVFIDGMHLFDFVIMEMYYADKLLSVGGFLVFDDVQMPGVQEAVLFVLQNRHYAVVNCFDVEKRITILRKTQQDDRECVTALALVWVECMCVQCASILGAFVHSRW